MMKSQVRIGAVLSYINMAIGSLIPMVYTPIMLSLLGQDEYGLYKLSNSVTSYLSLISFGIGSAVVRYFTKYIAEGDKDGEEGIFGLFNVIFMVISGITMVAGVIISLNVGLVYSDSLSAAQLVEMQILIVVLSLNTAISFLCSPQNAVVTSHERYLFLQIINILTTIAAPVANLIALFLGFKSIGLAISSLVLTIIVRIVYIIYVRKTLNIKPRYKNMPTNLLKEILVFSFWIFVSNVVGQLYNSTDTIIIGAVPALATVGVAVYNIGITFNNMLYNFSVGITSVLSPKVNKLVFSNTNNRDLTDLLIRVGRIQCYIVTIVCMGFITFGRQFIQLWAGDNYQEAYFVAIFTMIPASVPLMQGVALSIVIAKNKHRFRSLVYLGIAVANVIGTILLVNTWGIVGAAFMTGLSNILGQGIVMNWYYWKKIGLEIPRFWKSVSNIFIVPAALMVIFMFLTPVFKFDTWLTFLAGVIVFTVLFVIISWLFIMTDYEKDIVRGPLNKIIKKFKRLKKQGE